MTRSKPLKNNDPLLPGEDNLPNLSSQQYVLYKAFGEIGNGSLARIYIGAIYVLSDSRNPDRFCLAAHEYRELLSKLPKYLGFDTTPLFEKTDTKIVELTEIRERVQQNQNRESLLDESGQWLREFLLKIQEFFDWYKKLNPRRTQVVVSTLRKLDPASVILPEHVEKQLVQEWQFLYRYFVGIAHHDKPIKDQEFEERVEDLERYLIVRLRPQTFADIDEIGKLIKEVENNDRS